MNLKCKKYFLYFLVVCVPLFNGAYSQENLLDKYENSLVYISATTEIQGSYSGTTAASGFVVCESGGYVLTNFHIIPGHDNFGIQGAHFYGVLGNNNNFVANRFKLVYENHSEPDDLLLLRFEGSPPEGIKAVEIGSTDTVTPGTNIGMLSYAGTIPPIGEGDGKLFRVVNEDRVFWEFNNLDARNGDSGAPIFNIDDETTPVVAVLQGRINERARAIPIHKANSLIQNTPCSKLLQDEIIIPIPNEFLCTDQTPPLELDSNLKSALGFGINDVVTCKEVEQIGEESRTALKVIDLVGKNIENIKGVEYLYKAFGIDLTNNNVSDLTSLGNIALAAEVNTDSLPSLNILRLQNNNISDIGPLSTLFTVTELNLRDNKIKNISALRDLTFLRKLWLGAKNKSSNAISDLTPLENHGSLVILDLSRNKGVLGDEDLQALKNNIHLRTLLLHNAEFDDLSTLSNFEFLTGLDLVSAGINQSELEFLASLHESLKHLEGLGLSNHKTPEYRINNTIENLEPISKFTKLKGLSVGNNRLDKNINQLELLSNNTDIRCLYLYGNNLRNINGISALQDLLRLQLTSNRIKNIDELMNLDKLYYLDLDGNLIKDINPLLENENLNKKDVFTAQDCHPFHTEGQPEPLNNNIKVEVRVGLNCLSQENLDVLNEAMNLRDFQRQNLARICGE